MMEETAAVSGEEKETHLPKVARSVQLKWFFIGGAAVFLIWAWATTWIAPIVEPDINQHRRNTILPPPRETSQIRQTFTPAHNGLVEVEVKISREATGESGGRFELQLLNDAGDVITAVSLLSNELAHEQVYRLEFEPQTDSAGQTYTLLASGTANNDVSLWGYDLDVHAGGGLSVVGGETAAQDLYLISRYQLTFAGAVKSLWHALTRYGSLLLVALVYILMPGCLLLVLWQVLSKKRLFNQDAFTWLGAALALGLALWPILWQFLSIIGLRLSGGLLWVVLVAGWIVTGGLFVRFRPTRFTKPVMSTAESSRYSVIQLPITKYQLRSAHLALLLILLFGLAARFLAVRDQTIPLWVDASRHGLITAVMADTGQVIEDYQPFLDVDRFPYHYGFHTISAGLIQLTGRPLPETLLALGQLLNGLIPLTIYGATFLFTRRRLAGLTAAFLVALPFFFPAYYATWGRMTQLTGVLLLPILLALTWKVVRGAKWWRASWWLVSLLAAGLFLIHFRVFLLYLVFAGVVWLFSLGRNGRRLLASGLLTLLLTAPRIWQLLADTNPARAVANNLPGYNDFPTGYVTTGWEEPFLILAGLALLLAIVAAVMRRRWAYGPLFLVVWVGVTAVLLSGNRLGLPETSLININSAYIIVFVPLTLVLGMVGATVWGWLMGRHWLIRSAAALVVGAAVSAAAVFGLEQQITILNPETILAWPQDQAGLDWLEQHTSPDAKAAVNAFLWLGTTWAGQDGGAWIVPLTGRQSTTPPADYIYDPTLAVSVGEFNTMAKNWGNWADPSVADQLRAQGVTHLFVGAGGGFMDPAELAQNPEMRLLFGQEGVFIFALSGGQ